jgi:outer membrane murein-binding lipoprotein Lpp
MKSVLRTTLVAAALTSTALVLAACAPNAKLARYEADAQAVQAHIATFDTLDFDVFTHQKWDRLHESHSKDVIVHWPDGRVTRGIDVHIEDLKAMFVFAPDTRIEVHPIKFGSGEWTGVVGVMEGTFSRPMPIAGGKSIPPTGKKFKLEMATVGHWKDGVMDEEYLFWDNLAFMRQIGLAQ